MHKPIVITTPSLRNYGYRRLVAGLMVGAFCGFLFAQTPTAPPAVEDKVQKACGWPRNPGASLMVGVDGHGKQYCWRND